METQKTIDLNDDLKNFYEKLSLIDKNLVEKLRKLGDMREGQRRTISSSDAFSS